MTNLNEQTEKKNFWFFAIALAAVGMGLSLYSIKHHLDLKLHGHTNAICNINSAISCDAVAASKYSEILGFPLGVWGLGYFLAMLFLAATVWKDHKTKKENEPTWLLMALIGMISSIILGSISIGALGAICLVCIAIYVVTIFQAITGWFIWSSRRGALDFSLRNFFGGGTSAVIAVALVAIGFNFLKPAAQLPTELQDTPGKFDASPPTMNLSPKFVEIPINKNAYSGLGEDFRRGSDDAKIVIVEFADYICPACGQTAPIIEQLSQQLGSKALVVFKNFPLSNQCNSGVQSDMHPYSCEIAKLARCAGGIGKFWEYHLRAFAEQSTASSEKAKAWGKGVGLADAQIAQCLKSPDILAKIKDDVEVANKLGVNSTPTVYINGKQYLGDRTVEAMKAVIDAL